MIVAEIDHGYFSLISEKMGRVYRWLFENLGEMNTTWSIDGEYRAGEGPYVIYLYYLQFEHSEDAMAFKICWPEVALEWLKP